MAERDRDGVFDFGEMSDDEIRAVVIQQFREYPNIDVDDLQVSVRDGFVTLAGQVGTDGEFQVAESILHDVLGIEDYANEIGVDEVDRELTPEGTVDAAVAEEENDDQTGDPPRQQSDTAEHLDEDIETATYGTRDAGTAIRDATPYIPPDRPMPEGYESTEDH